MKSLGIIIGAMFFIGLSIINLKSASGTSNYVKYLSDHPDIKQLKVRLTQLDGEITSILRDRGKTFPESRFGQTANKFKGQQGVVKAASTPIEPVTEINFPQITQGIPGRPASFSLPAGAHQSGFSMDNNGQAQISTTEQTGDWQTIKRETFEGVFPNAGWELVDGNSGDNKQYLWDDDDYRPHNGYWAAWPANGGADGLDPENSNYPPNMSSWMIYGPFDLSDAKQAEVSFYLWREIEPNYDYIFFGVSHDGNEFRRFTWDGTVGWEKIGINLDEYLGDSSVWVAWIFESDATVQYEGPWVDDILIRKYVPGQVTVYGTLTYSDRYGNSAPAGYTNVYLYDSDPGGTDDLLAVASTNADGYYEFPAITNWDDDDSDPDPYNRRLDLYVVYETEYSGSGSAHRRVINFSGQEYQYQSYTYTNAPDGYVDRSTYIPSFWNTLRAMWIFQYLRNAWEKVYYGASIDPGSVTAKWEKDKNCYLLDEWICSSFFYAYPGNSFIFIQDDSAISADIVVHKVGHHYMYNATGWWLHPDIYGCLNHNVFTQEGHYCAWSEGWADFLPLVVNGDECYDFDIGPCTGRNDIDYYNLEYHSLSDNEDDFPFGDTVEGRVAGALYDMYDNIVDGHDSAYFGFAPIANIVFLGPGEERFSEFWEHWQATGYNEHHAVRAIYQNTIDYNTTPRFDPPVPDQFVLENLYRIHAVDLWDYSTDDESNDWELRYFITSVSDSRCGVSLDDHWVDIVPQQNWLGSCNITIQVNDSLRVDYDTFKVTVVPVRGKVHLPIVMLNP